MHLFSDKPQNFASLRTYQKYKTKNVFSENGNLMLAKKISFMNVSRAARKHEKLFKERKKERKKKK